MDAPKNDEDIIVDQNHYITEVIDSREIFITSMIFNHRDEMIQWAQKVGRANGIVIVVSRLDFSDPRRLPRLFLGCERGGYYRPHRACSPPKRKRSTSTKRCGCPFKLKCMKLSLLQDHWIIQVLNGNHNHPLIEHMEGHSFVGRLLNEEYELLRGMTKSGVRPRDILSHLKDRDGSNASTLTTIYNAIGKIKKEETGGRTNMQQLFKLIYDAGFVEQHRKDLDSGRLVDIFWAHPTSIALVKAFPFVFMLDCTYKTNRYRMPLLEIVGVTSTNKTFSAAFVYMEAEKEINYTWALQCFRELFDDMTLPSVMVTDREQGLTNALNRVFSSTTHLLCRFHIEKNVLANCRKEFATNETWDEFFRMWAHIMKSTSEEEYEEWVFQLEKEFENYIFVLNYVRDLLQMKQKFVSACVDKHFHLGNTTTNRVEGNHAKLKKYLCSSMHNLVSSWGTIKGLLDQQVIDIKASFEQSLTKIPHSLRRALLKDLIGITSITALLQIKGQIELSDSIGVDPNACSHVIFYTHGIPCACMIVQYKREGRLIPLEDIHPFWMKLSITPYVEGTEEDVDIATEMDMISKNWSLYNYNQKMEMKRKLKLLSDPTTTHLLEPMEKINVRGRKSMKRQKKSKVVEESSTKRDPSHWEHVLASIEFENLKYPAQGSQNIVKPEEVVVKPEKKMKRYTTKEELLKMEFPTPLLPYIKRIINVASDGHCGFRVIAGSLGLGDDSWRQVRRDLLAELDAHVDLYTPIFYGNEHMKELRNSLLCEATVADKDHWMIMPDMGHLIASCYRVILVYISLQLCLTFLPLWSPVSSSTPHSVFHMGFVNGCHFVRIEMDVNGPIPPVSMIWSKHHHISASDWLTPYVDRMKLFKTLFKSRDVATTDTLIQID